MAEVEAGTTLSLHTGRVRALRADRGAGRVGTVGADQRVAFWSTETATVERNVPTRDYADLTCLEVDRRHGLWVVGGRQFASFIDPRCPNVVRSVPSQDRNMGIRSLCMHRMMLSMGGGMGRLTFFDVVGDKLLSVPDEQGHELKPYHTVSSGWMLEAGESPQHAVYTHRYNPSGSQLFVGGGPLLLHENGSYAAIW